MRIIAGTLKGRHFEAVKGHNTHPMSEKARGGLFSALGDIDNLSVLDAFAGTGALSFEAISRGAAHATTIDIDRNAINTVVKNAKGLGIASQVKAIRANVSSWSDNNKSQEFDIIICDPPYDKLQIYLLQKLTRHLADNGIYVLSWPGKLEIPEFQYLKIVKSKPYGDAQLVFYRKIG